MLSDIVPPINQNLVSDYILYGNRPRTFFFQEPILKVEYMNILIEFWAFLRVRKKLWLAPLILVMVMLGGLLILAQGSVVAPFIYALF